VNTLHEVWGKIEIALCTGARGLPKRNSLAKLLAEHRGVRNPIRPPALFERTGNWPNDYAGPVFEAPEENWSAISNSLHGGYRGLPGGSSLARLLEQERGRPHVRPESRLSHKLILQLADDHHGRMGRWPTRSSGAVLLTAAAPPTIAMAPQENDGTAPKLLSLHSATAGDTMIFVAQFGRPFGMATIRSILSFHRGTPIGAIRTKCSTAGSRTAIG
jgi:hypothetical protein